MFLFLCMAYGLFVPHHVMNYSCFYCKALITDNDKIITYDGFPSVHSGIIRVNNIAEENAYFEFQTGNNLDGFGTFMSVAKDTLITSSETTIYTVDVNSYNMLFNTTLFSGKQYLYTGNDKYLALLKEQYDNYTIFVYDLVTQNLMYTVELCDFGLSPLAMGMFSNADYFMVELAFDDMYQMIYIDWTDPYSNDGTINEMNSFFIDALADVVVMDSFNHVYVTYSFNQSNHLMKYNLVENEIVYIKQSNGGSRYTIDRQHTFYEHPVSRFVACNINKCDSYDSNGQKEYEIQLPTNISNDFQCNVNYDLTFITSQDTIYIFRSNILVQTLEFTAPVRVIATNYDYLIITEGNTFKTIHVYYTPQQTSPSSTLYSLFAF